MIRPRDYALAERISKLGDDVLVGIHEAAAVSGLSPLSLQQRRVKTFPRPLEGLRRLRWRLGDIRAWMRAANPQESGGPRPIEDNRVHVPPVAMTSGRS